MGIWTLAKPTPPGIFTPAILLYHLLPLHAPLTLFVLDAPFGRFNQSKSIFNVNGESSNPTPDDVDVTGNIAWFAMEIVAVCIPHDLCLTSADDSALDAVS